MCYHAEFGRSALHAVGINTGGQADPQNWGALEIRSLGMEGVADFKIHALPHLCYHVKFGSSATVQMVYQKIERNTKNWGALGPAPLW